MDCFKQFIKYNPKLIELDLSNCKLNNTAILYLAYCLRRAQSLRVLHLCGNMARPKYRMLRDNNNLQVDEEDAIKVVINRVAERLHAKTPIYVSLVIRPYQIMHVNETVISPSIKKNKAEDAISPLDKLKKQQTLAL